MLRRPTTWIALAVSTALAAAQPALSPAGRQADLDSFEHVWKTVRDNHWDPKLGGLDWQAIHDELRPKVEAATTRDQARQVMSGMLERLKQTHFGIFPGDVYQALNPGEGGSHPANPGLDLRVLDGHAIVTSVNPGSPAATRGIQPGWEILSVDGKEVAPVVKSIQEQFHGSTLLDLRLTRAVLARLQGQLDSAVSLALLDGRGRKVTLEVTRATPRGKIASLGNFPGDYFWTEWRRIRGNVGYIRFNMFMDPEALTKTMEEAVNGCRDCRGFVIDVRGNPGGIGGLAMGVAGWFTDQSGLRLGTSYLRTATIKFVIFPRPQPFLGPLAVLVDGCSASTAEIFAGGLKDIQRARVFGTRTAGAALPSVIEKLPNGDGFQYAIANYISEGGQPLEGIGVTPDEELRLSRGHLLEGRDSVLEGALDWIQKAKL